MAAILSFDTHARWQPVTQSARSRRSYGNIEDREQPNPGASYYSTSAQIYKINKPYVISELYWITSDNFYRKLFAES